MNGIVRIIFSLIFFSLLSVCVWRGNAQLVVYYCWLIEKNNVIHVLIIGLRAGEYLFVLLVVFKCQLLDHLLSSHCCSFLHIKSGLPQQI